MKLVEIGLQRFGGLSWETSLESMGLRISRSVEKNRGRAEMKRTETKHYMSCHKTDRVRERGGGREGERGRERGGG